MQKVGSAFHFFDDAACHVFLMIFQPKWKLPPPEAVGGILLDDTSSRTMENNFDTIKTAEAGDIGIDGATKVLSTYMGNAIVQTPLPKCVASSRAYMNRETTENVAEKLRDMIGRFDERLRFRCAQAFISDSCNGMGDLRKMPAGGKLVHWAHGCVAHYLNNY